MRLPSEERLIVALDVPAAPEAARWAKRLSPAVKHFKIGLELFTGGGPAVFKNIPNGVFLDLKFFDIPNTMVGALNAAASLNPFLVNVHALAGPAALEQCARAVKSQRPRPRLLAVTILTSFTGPELRKIGVNVPMEKMVSRLCGIALEAGCDGVVASPLEAPRLRKEYGKKFLIVTPGVRPAWSAKNDQQRVATPAEAIRNGADYIVVGRPILAAPKPLEAARMVIEEIRRAGRGQKR